MLACNLWRRKEVILHGGHVITVLSNSSLCFNFSFSVVNRDERSLSECTSSLVHNHHVSYVLEEAL